MSTSAQASGPESVAPPSGGDRFPLAAVHAALFLLGVMLGLWGAFLVPLRLAGGTEGLAVLVAFGGNLGVGVAAAWAGRSVPLAATAGIGWLVTVLALTSIARPADEVVLPGRLGSDPGIGTVATLFLVAGLAGVVLAILIANRFTRPPPRPTSMG